VLRPVTAPPEELAAALAGRYRLDRLIAAGGMGMVYLAADLRHRRQVAVKVLAPVLAMLLGPARFETEIRVTAALSHPNILPLFDSGVAEGFLYYVMPYVEEGSLRDRLQSGQPMPIRDVLRVAKAVAGALDHAHAQGVIHRDIKPENILLRGDTAYLADFGIALLPSEERRTAPGLHVGTPAYMSPEQIETGTPVDGRADVYALACVVYEMLGGAPPFHGHTRGALAAHLSDPVPPIARKRPSIPDSVDQVLRRALAKLPDQRFPRATEFIATLEAVVAGQAPEEPAHATPPWELWGAPRPWRLEQEIGFCRASDGVRLAWATSGDGFPLVKVANWLSHLEFDAASPIWQHWWKALSERFRLIRYDERGSGLSQWEVENISFEAWITDLEAVINAAGCERFALLGVSKGSAIAVAYAARHPERVSHLVLHGGFARGKRLRDTAAEEHERIQLEIAMIRLGWGGRNAAFRQAFTTMFFPGASPGQAAWFNELQRVSASPENAARIVAAAMDIDVRALAGAVRCPTLVLHSRDDARVPFQEGRLLASLIPGARFVPLPGANHLPLEHDPTWNEFLRELDRFFRIR
jgi:pimeloyl-ACP methyl ester carboxylesterase